MMKSSRLIVLLLVVVLLAGCGPAPLAAPAPAPAGQAAPGAAEAPVPAAQAEPAVAQPVQGGRLVRAMTSEPAQIDPQGAPSSGLSLVLPYLFDTLVARDVDGAVTPQLAESWDVSEDGLAITMKLKEGVTFQDGTPLNAEAVKFTFDRFKEQGQRSPIYSGVAQIGGVEVIDDTFASLSTGLTVRFTFPEPTANFFGTISMPYAGIISPASAAQVAEAGQGNLVGTGAFSLGEWLAGQSITLVHNPDYAWAPPFMANQGAPYLDELVFKVIPDATTQLAALEAGEVDMIFVNQPSHLLKLRNQADVEIEEAVLNSLIYLGYNCQQPPFDEVLVRQALSHAVNKEEIVNVALGGLGQVAYTPLPPTLPGFDPALKAFELSYDPAAAKALLQEAGFSQNAGGNWERDGQVLRGRLLTSNRAPNDIIATLLQAQLKAIGVPVEIQQLDSKAVMDATAEGAFDLLLWRFEWNDPDGLAIFLGSDRIGSTNRAKYSNADVDALLAQGAHELDQQARLAYYVEAQKILLTEAPWQPLYNPVDVIAMRNSVHDVEIGYMGRMLVNDAYVAQ